eukprot:5342996-Amphidinium_carterae.1
MYGRSCGWAFFVHYNGGKPDRDPRLQKRPIRVCRVNSPCLKSAQDAAPLLAPEPCVAVAEEQGETDIDPFPDDATDDLETSSLSLRCRIAKEYHMLSTKICPEALAQSSHTLQVDAFDHVLGYLRCMQVQKRVQGVMMVHHVLYDETPLRLRVSFSDQGQGSRTQDTQLAKVYVIEQSWSVLCQEQSIDGEENAYMLLRASMSPSLRCAATGSAANLASIMSSIWSPPESARQLCS